jgi:hypothetical protein
VITRRAIADMSVMSRPVQRELAAADELPRRGTARVWSAEECSAGERMRTVPGSPRLRLTGYVLVGADDPAFAARSGL